MAASVPAILPAVAAGAQSRPAPPTARAHHRVALRPEAGHAPRHARSSVGALGAEAAPGGIRPMAAPATTHTHVRLLPLGSPATAAPAASAMPGTPSSTGASALPTSAPGALASGAAPGRAQQAPGRAQRSVQQHAPEQGRDLRDAPTALVLKVAMGKAAPRTVTLLCDPPGGTHPKAAQACADLARSHGDFSIKPSGRKPRACFMIYSPVTVSAEGRWHGEDVRFTARYPNTCVMLGQTGAIFDF